MPGRPRLDDGQERERKEIGKELHDNIGQQLATTKLYLDLAQTADSNYAAGMLARASKSISDLINEVRNMSHSLVPPSLGDLGLVESVQELVATLRFVQKLQITFIHDHFCEAGLPENMKLMLYRIIQEALNNVLKHAHARTVQIVLSNNLRFLLFEIKDDGQGFAPEKMRKGLGLNNIRNRAALFSGKVIIKTATGKGCTIKAVIPVPGGVPAR